MASVHDHVGLIKTFLKMSLVGFEMQRRRLDAARVREHAIGRNNDVGFDAKGADHAARYSWLSELTSDRNSARVCAWSRNTPSIRLVTRSAPRLRTPRSIMQWCAALATTATPQGLRTSWTAVAICAGSRS